MSDRLQRELDRLVAVLDRGVSVDDVHGRLLGFSAREGVADAARVSAILTRKVSPDVLAWERRHGIEQAQEPVRIDANQELGIDARLCLPLRESGHLLGYLWVLEKGDRLGPDDVSVLQDAAPVVAAAVRDAIRPATTQAGLVQELLQGASDRRAQACEELISAHPALLNRPVYCQVVAASDRRQQVVALPQQVYLSLEGLLHGTVADQLQALGGGVSTRRLVALAWAHRDLAESHRQWRDALTSHVQASAPIVLTVGTSEPFLLGTDTLTTGQQQAVAAAEVAAVDPAVSAELGWVDAGVYRQLVPISSGRPWQAHPGWHELAERDPHGTLRHTLEVYLDRGGDVGATATELHLHRTSLYYRLDRISQIAGVDLRDGLTRLGLHLTLKLQRLDRR